MLDLVLSCRKLTIRKLDFELEQRTLPDSLVAARNHAFPTLEIEGALRVLHGFCDEAKRVIFAPCLPEMEVSLVIFLQDVRCFLSPLLLKPAHAKRHVGLLIVLRC